MPPKKKQSAWSIAAEAVNKQQQNVKTEKQESIETEEPQQGLAVESQSGITDNHDDIEAELQQKGKEEGHQKMITEKSDSVQPDKRENSKTAEQQNEITGTEDKPTEKVTLYLTWKQLDKLDNMALEYKRRTRKRTDHNKLMRMMVDKFDLDDLLSE